MKIEEMADMLDGLASFMERFMGKSDLNDVRAVTGCFRQFSGETVASVCNAIIKAKEGKLAGGRSPAGVDQAKVEDLATRIIHFLDNRHSLEFSHIDELMTQCSKLKLAEIKAVGDRIECSLSGRTKAVLIATLRNWLRSIKLSADQSSFRFSTADASS